MGKAGRPFKLDEERKALYLTEIRAGQPRGKAAEAAGVRPETVNRAMIRDEEFREAVILAETEAHEAGLDKVAWPRRFNGMGRPGRPPKFNARRRSLFLRGLRAGQSRVKAAETAGVSYSTVRNAIRDEPDFREMVEQAEAEAHEVVEDALFRAARSGNARCIIFYLCNRCPERWKPLERLVEPEQKSFEDGRSAFLDALKEAAVGAWDTWEAEQEGATQRAIEAPSRGDVVEEGG